MDQLPVDIELTLLAGDVIELRYLIYDSDKEDLKYLIPALDKALARALGEKE